VRIDRSDLAEEPDGTHIARRARSTPDDPDAANKNQDNAGESDGPLGSSPARLDSGLRIERAAAYRAAVDAAYRQDAIDHDYARAEKPERETATPTMRPDETTAAAWAESALGKHDSQVRERTSDFHDVAQLASGDTCHTVAKTTLGLIRDAGGFEYPTKRTAADDLQTGARGLASGREFDPEAAGGPVQHLEAGKARITSEGVQEVTAHLQRFTGGGALAAPEQAMLDRLTSIAADDMEPASYDLNFYTHELDEAARYAQLGLGPESGVDLGSPTMYDVWNDVHTAALEDYGISGADLFHPEHAP
jgi:hypothetical protein